MLLEYGIELEKEPEGVTLTAPDIPGVVTYGDDVDEALRNGVGAFAALIHELIAQRKEIPAPGPIRPGQKRIALPSLMAQKVLLYNTMREQRINGAELARRLGKAPTHVTRLLDVLHASRHDQLDEALAILGRRYKVDVGPLLYAAR